MPDPASTASRVGGVRELGPMEISSSMSEGHDPRPALFCGWLSGIMSQRSDGTWPDPDDWSPVVRDLDESLRRESTSTVSAPCAATDQLLAHAHQRFGGSHDEHRAWEDILHRLPTRLPDAIANELINRNIAIDALGHGRHSDAVLRQLVDRVDEALLTLAIRAYESDAPGSDGFEAFIHQYRDHPAARWMLETLSLRDPKDDARHRLVLGAIDALPDEHPGLPPGAVV